MHGALRRTAHHTGAELGAAARGLAGPGAGPAELLQAVELLLTAHGYEPYRADDNIRLRNCPFHALAAEHRDLVCGMNHALMQGVLDGLALPGVEAVLDPQPGRCCVAFRAGAAH